MNLNQVTFSSLDLEKSVVYYKLLGLRLIADALQWYARFECPDRDATFSIHEANKLVDGPKRTLYFEVENLSATVSKLKRKDVIFKTDTLKQSWR